MTFRTATEEIMIAIIFAGGAILHAASPSQAETLVDLGELAAVVPWTGQGCGWGAYRAPNGSCDIVMDPNWRCSAGFHNVATPVANGYRCVQDGY